MITIERSRTPVDLKQFKKRTALVTDFHELITEDTLLTEDGVPRILYVRIPEEKTALLRQCVRKIKYASNTRTNGLKTSSRIFGYNPRNPIRKNYCSATSLAVESPTENALISEFGAVLAELYLQCFPDVFAMHSSTVKEKIDPSWTIPETPFTSGIVNKNNPLKYHFDAGNISGVLSNMVVLKSGVEGGYLSCPEFGLGFECADNTAILFDGQAILHGVTPIQQLHERAYRYSVVYYTLKQMWNCLPISEEIIRARAQRVKRETKRAYGLGKDTDLERRER